MKKIRRMLKKKENKGVLMHVIGRHLFQIISRQVWQFPFWGLHFDQICKTESAHLIGFNTSRMILPREKIIFGRSWQNMKLLHSLISLNVFFSNAPNFHKKGLLESLFDNNENLLVFARLKKSHRQFPWNGSERSRGYISEKNRMFAAQKFLF